MISELKSYLTKIAPLATAITTDQGSIIMVVSELTKIWQQL
jgi:hypothetical protein